MYPIRSIYLSLILKLTSGVNYLNIVIRSALSDYEVSAFLAKKQLVLGTNDLASAMKRYKLRGDQKKVLFNMLSV